MRGSSLVNHAAPPGAVHTCPVYIPYSLRYLVSLAQMALQVMPFQSLSISIGALLQGPGQKVGNRLASSSIQGHCRPQPAGEAQGVAGESDPTLSPGPPFCFWYNVQLSSCLHPQLGEQVGYNTASCG